MPDHDKKFTVAVITTTEIDIPSSGLGTINVNPEPDVLDHITAFYDLSLVFHGSMKTYKSLGSMPVRTYAKLL